MKKTQTTLGDWKKENSNNTEGNARGKHKKQKKEDATGKCSEIPEDMNAKMQTPVGDMSEGTSDSMWGIQWRRPRKHGGM